MKPTYLKTLIIRYQSGKASRAERYIVERWLESFQNEEADKTLDDPQFLVLFQQGVVRQAFAKTPSLNIRHNQWRAWAIAAILLCVVSVSLIFYAGQPSASQNEVPQALTTGDKQIKRLTLPDSTIVYLNSNSSLEISGNFGKRTREVNLKGEAYFEVARDPSKPFKVQADRLAIKVFGTSFNINARQSLKDISVFVNSGEVQVSDPVKTLALLHAEDGISYDRDGKNFQLMRIPDEEKSSWWEGVDVLRNASYAMLKQVLYNRYAVTLEVADPALNKLTYTFTIRSTRTLEQTMDQLTAMLNKKYRKEANSVIIY